MNKELPELRGRLLPEQLRAEGERLGRAAAAFELAVVRDSTRVAYQRVWDRFVYWCGLRGFPSLPTTPAVFGAYLTAAASEGIPTVPKAGRPSRPGKPLNAKSLWVHMSAVAFAHQLADLPNPIAALKPTLKDGTLRDRTTVPVKKVALSRKQLLGAVTTLPDTLRGLRDRAILLVAFSGGRRRSEIAGMCVDQLQQRDHGGFTWTIPRTKTSDKPLVVPIPVSRNPKLCPARSLQAWLAAAKITEGPVFVAVDQKGRLRYRRENGVRVGIHPSAVADVVKEAVGRLGLDSDVFSGHSLRSGFATEAARAGVRAEDIMGRGGWRNVQTVYEYIRAAEQDDPNHPLNRLLELE